MLLLRVPGPREGRWAHTERLDPVRQPVQIQGPQLAACLPSLPLALSPFQDSLLGQGRQTWV